MEMGASGSWVIPEASTIRGSGGVVGYKQNLYEYIHLADIRNPENVREFDDVAKGIGAQKEFDHATRSRSFSLS